MVRKYVAETVYNSFVKPVVKAGKKLFTKEQKTTGEGAIKSVKPGTQLTKKRKSQDDFVDFRTKLHTSAGFDTATKNKLKMKHPLYKTMKKTSDIFTPKEPKFNKGGRVGLKRGTGLMKKKSNVDKIKETFNPKKKKKFPDLTGDGKVTFADILKGRGVINGKKKKKVI
jgi:hypothetical protein